MQVARLTGPSLKTKTIPGDSAEAKVLQSGARTSAVPQPAEAAAAGIATKSTPARTP
jgi:hypothetical protein